MTTILLFIFLIAAPLIYYYLIFPVVISPLSKLPNAHFTSRFSNIWIRWQRYRNRENRVIHQTHKDHGPIVRMGPTEVSVNCPAALKVVYSDACDRDEWYGRVFAHYGVRNMFSYSQRQRHAVRKRIVAPVYRKSTLQSSSDVMTILQVLVEERLLPILDAGAQSRHPINVLVLSLSFAMDYIYAYFFGLDCVPDLLRNPTVREEWLAAHAQEKRYGIWNTEFPALARVLRRLGIKFIPDAMVESAKKVSQLCLDLMDRNPGRDLPTKPKSNPVVYNHLAERFLERENGRLTLASELMDYLLAGTETSGWSLTYLMHELSQNPEIQNELRLELRAVPQLLPDSSLSSSIDKNTLQRLDTLPILDGVVLETLRRHPAAPGSQPRVTLSATSVLGYPIPPNTRIGAQAYSLHRNEDVFPHAETWDPYRWVYASSTKRAEMMQWWWVFGSGGRMCVGKWFALLELKMVLARIYSNYRTWVVGMYAWDVFDLGYSSLMDLLKSELLIQAEYGFPSPETRVQRGSFKLQGSTSVILRKSVARI
ncbi:cytochrome P450 [Aspergillus coremiiformis]|uniref:Cytochrome P450 n=1 Tax=Aspergillus coremiiformis TaxID=138285 RepID=A0A5N6Z723_9EURO|nr:cytochrome P450 [Aspergillus coremiiformis]